MENSFFQKIQNGTKAFIDAFNAKSCDDDMPCSDDAAAADVSATDNKPDDTGVSPTPADTATPPQTTAVPQVSDGSKGSNAPQAADDPKVPDGQQEADAPQDNDETNDAPKDDAKDETGNDGADTAQDKPEEDAAPDMDKPEVRLATAAELDGGGYVAACSIQGRGHIAQGVPCQDYHAFEDLGDGWLLAVTSDGAGSAREAARGSKANCDLAVRLVKQLLATRKWKERDGMPSEKEWYAEIRNVFEVMQAIIMRSCANQATQDGEAPEPRDFNATVIVLVVTPKGMMGAHIGDGRMGYLSADGSWHALMTPHKGDEASSTVFIPNDWNRQVNVPAFQMSGVYLPDTCVVAERPKAFVLMSDGCESFSWLCKTYDRAANYYYDRNLPYDKFFDPLVSHLNGVADKDERVAELIDIINVGTSGGRRETDDRTMLLGVLAR